MAMSDHIENKTGRGGEITPETYLRMNEREKDIEIEKAVARLQRRIQEILYMLEPEKKPRSQD